MSAINIPYSAETGSLGIRHLKRYWAIATAKRNGELAAHAYTDEWVMDNFLLNTLGIGIEQTVRQLYFQQPSFAAFEQWILEQNNGYIPPEKIRQFHDHFTTATNSVDDGEEEELVLSAADLQHWEKNGFVIIREAISKDDCKKTRAIINELLQIDEDDASTWYGSHSAKEGIMVQLFQHPIINANRHAPRIKKAYQQLWQRKDILVNIDKVGFNPPENANWKFPASSLHWDVSLQLPIPFGTQGLLYLSDTSEEQGAFTVVPGFHHRIHDWINSLPAGVHPRHEDLTTFGAIPIAANAGDFIIWHHALPHGASPNRAMKPRYVQYMNYAPAQVEVQEKWI